MMTYLPIDEELCKAVSFRMPGQELSIEFQFPPKILSDSRKGNWEEKDNVGSEPIAIYKTSGAREISLNFVYIVDGGKWTTKKISEQIRNLRGYFTRYISVGQGRGLVVMFKMWRHGGANEMSCRIRGVDVKHSDSIVVPDGVVSDAYALRSDVTIDLRIWSKGGIQKIQDVPGLRTAQPPDWY